jgi:ATP-dependent protease ClpP protease subunit
VDELMRMLAEVKRPTSRHARPTSGERREWFRIGNHDPAAQVTDVWLFDEIGYWGVTADDFARSLQAVTSPRITLHVNSPGGDVFDGIAIYSTLKNHPAAVDVRIEGLAASAASFIAMAGDTITVEKPAQMMIHDASGICIGDARDMTSMADLLARISDTIAAIYADRTGTPVEQWREAMLAETWYSSGEAVAAGLADSVAGEPAEDGDEATPGEAAPEDNAPPPAVDASWDLSGFLYAGRDAAPAPALPVAQAPAEDGQEKPAAPADAPAATDPPIVVPDTAGTPDPDAAAGAPTDDWGGIVAQLVSSTPVPVDPIGAALACLREAATS